MLASIKSPRASKRGEEEDINEGLFVIRDVHLCRYQIYHLISDENVVTMETIFE